MELLVNFYPLLLIFAVSLIVHLLINRLTVICEAILKLTGLKKSNNVQDDLLKEISALQEEQSALNPIDDFAKHSKLQRKIIAKQSILKDTVGQQKKSLRWNVRFRLYIILRVLMELITILTVWHCHQQPVVVAPEEWFYPLGKSLYPLWSKGTVAPLFWMISCRLAWRQFWNSGYLL